MTAKLEKCAEILGVKIDSLNEFPDKIREKLVSCMEIYSVSNADDARQQYEEMERYWRMGTLVLGMREISENTGISQDKLVNLTENEKLNLMYEYAIGTDKDTLLKIIES